MNQHDWVKFRETQISRALIDLLRKKISEEEYKRIRDQT